MSDRLLLTTADDFGIGPETSRGILDLAERGIVRSTVLLVNSPFARDGVRQWRRRGRPVELGWHPCLTLDSPLLPPQSVPTLVDRNGRFHQLGRFLRRLCQGRLSELEIESELSAQYERFLEMTDLLPRNVNCHHHLHVFGPVRRALARVLEGQDPLPYVRRVIETRATLFGVPGGRIKRMLLAQFGQRQPMDFPGNDELIGITDPPFVHGSRFFVDWLARSTGAAVELTCHPGHFDRTLVGRDGTLDDGQIHRRAVEYERLSDPSFLAAILDARFQSSDGDRLARRSVFDRASVPSLV
jgi:chitin disaccharide deacetylase